MGKLQVYCDPCTVNSHKVTAGLALIGTDYDLHHVDYFKGEHKKPEYLKINPMGTVPSAVDDDLHLTESNAILMYAADLKDSPAYPKDLKKRAEVNKWLFWEPAWFSSCYIPLIEYAAKPVLGAQPDDKAVEAGAERWNQLASVLEGQLSKTKWLAGDEVTIADISVASSMHLHGPSRLPLDKYPHLKKWMTEGIEALPSWKETQRAVDKVFVPGAAAAVNGNSNAVNGGESTVQATFNYTKDVDKLTELYFYESEDAKNIHEPGDDPHEMAITDGWHRAKTFSIDKEGFSVEDFKTDFNQYEDEDLVREKFYPQVVEFLKKTTGAKRVLVFDHTIRTKANVAKKLTQETNTSQRAPVMLVHCDYTAESGPLRVHQLLPDEADDLLSRRCAFINVWKPIRGVVKERPLAMCDVTSCADDDFFKLYLRYRERTGENYVMRHSSKHKWWYFPEITPEQVILLKTYESESDGRARFVGHSAFEDPNSSPDAPPRESVEIRTIAFF